MKRILLIDDDEFFRDFVKQLLTRAGYEVLPAPNGREGLKLLAQSPVDLVLTDIIMPEKEGLETIMEIRRQQPETRIIAMSGGSRVSAACYLDMAAKLGARRTLQKPIESDDLLRTVQETLAT